MLKSEGIVHYESPAGLFCCKCRKKCVVCRVGNHVLTLHIVE